MNSASRTDWSEDTAVPAMLAGPLPAVALRQVSKAYGHGPAAEVTEQLREEVRRHAHD